MAFLNSAERRSVLDKVLAVIDAKFMGPVPDTKALRTKHGDVVSGADTRQGF